MNPIQDGQELIPGSWREAATSGIHSRISNGQMAPMSTDRRSTKDREADRERRLRLAFLEGAEQHSRRTLGRGLTEDELRRVTDRFPRNRGTG